MNEDTLEQACLAWLSGLGYECLHGDQVSPGGEQEARGRYSEVVLVPRLRQAVARLNPALSADQVDQVVAKLATYGSQSLVDGNKEIYDWLRNGVPLEQVESDGRRTVGRIPVIDFAGSNDLLAVRQFTVHGLKIRRPDIVLFVNGLLLTRIQN